MCVAKAMNGRRNDVVELVQRARSTQGDWIEQIRVAPKFRFGLSSQGT